MILSTLLCYAASTRGGGVEKPARPKRVTMNMTEEEQRALYQAAHDQGRHYAAQARWYIMRGLRDDGRWPVGETAA